MPDTVMTDIAVNPITPAVASSPVLIFSYGSSMLSSVIKDRCPSAEYYAIASIPDYELCFPRWSKLRRSYIAGFRKRPGKTLWGVLWTIPESELHKLDAFEDYRPDHQGEKRYERIRKLVHPRQGNPICAETYQAVVEHEDGRPSRSYRDLLIAGANENSLPAEYVKYLRKLPYTGDPIPPSGRDEKLRLHRFMEYCTEHPALSGPGLYLYICLLGVIYNSILMINRGVNPVGYYDINDFILSGLRHPGVILIAVLISVTCASITMAFDHVVQILINMDEVRRRLARSWLGSACLGLLTIGHRIGRSTHFLLIFTVFILLGLPSILASDDRWSRTCKIEVNASVEQEPGQSQSLQGTKTHTSSVSGLLIGSTEKYLFVSNEDPRPPSASSLVPVYPNTRMYDHLSNKVLPLDKVSAIVVTRSQEYLDN